MAKNLGNLVYRHGASRGTLVALAVCAGGCPVLALVIDSLVAPGTTRLVMEAAAVFLALAAAIMFGLFRSTRLELYQHGLRYRSRSVLWTEIDTVRTSGDTVTIEVEDGPAIAITQQKDAKDLAQRIQRSIGTRVTR